MWLKLAICWSMFWVVQSEYDDGVVFVDVL